MWQQLMASVAGDALVVPGKIAGQQVDEILCDSGATICVIAEHLIPKDRQTREGDSRDSGC